MKKLTETLIGATEQRKKHLIAECNNRIEILNDNEQCILWKKFRLKMADGYDVKDWGLKRFI